MKTEAWLRIEGKVQRHGPVWPGSIQVSKKKPSISPGSIIVKIDIDVPHAYFKEHQVTVKLALPEPVQDLKAIAGIAKDTAAQLSKQTGFSINVSVPQVNQ